MASRTQSPYLAPDSTRTLALSKLFLLEEQKKSLSDTITRLVAELDDDTVAQIFRRSGEAKFLFKKFVNKALRDDGIGETYWGSRQDFFRCEYIDSEINGQQEKGSKGERKQEETAETLAFRHLAPVPKQKTISEPRQGPSIEPPHSPASSGTRTPPPTPPDVRASPNTLREHISTLATSLASPSAHRRGILRYQKSVECDIEGLDAELTLERGNHFQSCQMLSRYSMEIGRLTEKLSKKESENLTLRRHIALLTSSSESSTPSRSPFCAV
ncbi:MAG: hypothetical protein M1839_005888 [Geoglossum umbratile]|nr:MAG: hypothetical protein M1839_005888 [Geoglossum umbratile]